MTISKDWLQVQMEIASRKKEEMQKLMDDDKEPQVHPLTCQGMVMAFQMCYTELTQPPKQQEKKAEEKIFDRDKVFADIVKYYVSKNYSLEHANEIAMKAVQDQEQKRLGHA